jgi:hypothetical protein
MNAQIVIREYEPALSAEVGRFNDRLREGGIPLSYPASHSFSWLPKLPGRTLFQEHYLAVDDLAMVRGGYILKREAAWIAGRSEPVADFQLPLSEGAINRSYSPVAVQLLRDALQRQPLLYALGIGGYDEPLAKLLAAAGWKLNTVPFFFRVVHPVAFLRNIVYLRQSAISRCALDFLARSGIGWLGFRTVQAACGLGRGGPALGSADVVAEFGDWATALWEENKDAYGMTIVRNADTLRLLYPKDANRFIVLRIAKDGKTIGWAVLLDTRLSGHRQLGKMRLGSLVDCFAAPEHAPIVVARATRFLERQGVDLIVSNQLHAVWRAALRAAGFVQGPSNYIFGAAPALSRLLQASHIPLESVHLNRGNGDGPINL